MTLRSQRDIIGHGHDGRFITNPWSKIVIAGTVGGACTIFTSCLVFCLLACRQWIRNKQLTRRRHLNRQLRSNSTFSTGPSSSTCQQQHNHHMLAATTNIGGDLCLPLPPSEVSSVNRVLCAGDYWWNDAEMKASFNVTSTSRCKDLIPPLENTVNSPTPVSTFLLHSGSGIDNPLHDRWDLTPPSSSTACYPGLTSSNAGLDVSVNELCVPRPQDSEGTWPTVRRGSEERQTAAWWLNDQSASHQRRQSRASLGSASVAVSPCSDGQPVSSTCERNTWELLTHRVITATLSSRPMLEDYRVTHVETDNVDDIEPIWIRRELTDRTIPTLLAMNQCPSVVFDRHKTEHGDHTTDDNANDFSHGDACQMKKNQTEKLGNTRRVHSAVFGK